MSLSGEAISFCRTSTKRLKGIQVRAYAKKDKWEAVTTGNRTILGDKTPLSFKMKLHNSSPPLTQPTNTPLHQQQQHHHRPFQLTQLQLQRTNTMTTNKKATNNGSTTTVR
eukprot:TRINITY_DN841_c0_g2_i13.p2 TRINITY_DN841_c0_g2~~TRINITY_DN841_c0_g2_i13.p2  ORF type:complete len:111 (+),score=25.82 TRINITY_DN841_c0_g2_i13:254-586(+)